MRTPTERVRVAVDQALDAVDYTESPHLHVMVIAIESPLPGKVTIQLGSTIRDPVTELLILRACVEDLSHDVRELMFPTPEKR